MHSRITILANPKARQAGKAEVNAIQAMLGELIPTDLIWTNNREETAQRIAELGRDPTHLLAVCGGDGSLLTAINALPAQGCLGLLPAGTANVVAREFGIPLQLREAAKVLISGAVASLDTGLVEGRRFLMVAGFGFDAHVARSVPGLTKRVLGQFSYHLESLVRYPTYRAPRLTVRVDGGAPQQGALLLVANLRRYGGNLFFATDARPDDGLLDVILLHSLDPTSLLMSVVSAHQRRGVPPKIAWQGKGKHIQITSDRPCPYQLDGEVFAPILQTEISLFPAPLRLITP